jgi:hypothetical protein
MTANLTNDSNLTAKYLFTKELICNPSYATLHIWRVCQLFWIFRTFRALSGCLQNLLAQERETGSPIDGTLNILQLIDFSLHRPIAVWKR